MVAVLDRPGLMSRAVGPDARRSRAPQFGCTAVYRLYSAEGGLLYVGMGGNPHERMLAHAREKPWWNDVDQSRTCVEWYASRRTARAEEKRAISNECPVHNVHGTDRHGVTLRRRADLTPLNGQSLVSVGTIRLCLGVSRQRVQQIVKRADFPRPTHELAMGKVWLSAEVEAWISAHRPDLAKPTGGPE